ncbi:MAG: hypothetical protein IT456_22300 [Planctomycetes bacterium]|nr:hypothetical protein [Planctomycetota bacterium]
MCTPVQIFTSIAGSLLSSALSGAMGGGKEEPKAAAVPKPPQEAKAPDTQRLRKENAGAAQAGPASTLLTGTDGVPTSELNLGRNNLLGL